MKNGEIKECINGNNEIDCIYNVMENELSTIDDIEIDSTFISSREPLDRSMLLNKISCNNHGKEKIAFILQEGKPTSIICLLCKSNKELKINEEELIYMFELMENNLEKNDTDITYCFKILIISSISC